MHLVKLQQQSAQRIGLTTVGRLVEMTNLENTKKIEDALVKMDPWLVVDDQEEFVAGVFLMSSFTFNHYHYITAFALAM